MPGHHVRNDLCVSHRKKVCFAISRNGKLKQSYVPEARMRYRPCLLFQNRRLP